MVFEDFTMAELMDVFVYLLRRQFGLDIADDARAAIEGCIEQLYRNRQLFAVNARTMQLLASTVAQIAQLRIFKEETGICDIVIKADTDRLEWSDDSLPYRRIGF